MKRYFKKHWKMMALWMFMELLGALAMVYWSFFMKGLSDTAFSGQDLMGIQPLLLFGLGFLVFYTIVELAKCRCRSRFYYDCNYSLKTDVFNRLIHRDINSFNSANSAKYISILNNDVSSISNYIFLTIPEIASNLIMMMVALATLFYFNPWIALVELVLCALPAIPTTFFGNQAAKGQKEQQEALDQMNAAIKDSFTGFEVIKGFSAEEQAERKFREKAERVASTGFRVFWEQNKAYAVAGTFHYLTAVIQLVFSVYLVVRGDITMGILMGAMQISNYVANPARNAVSEFLRYKTVRPVVERVVAILDGKTEDETLPGGQRTTLSGTGDIQLENLVFSYTPEREILHSLDYTFRAGKKYAIVGGSGSGKSTLIRLLMGYYSNYGGGIGYNGLSLKGIDRHSLYQRVAMIHQKVFLFEDTIRNNITMFQPYPEAEVLQAVHDAGLDEVVERCGGLDALVEENGRNLSGGEQQRVSIARAFIRGAEVMLVDEATASLDPMTAAQINQILLRKAGLTLIAVTHRTDEKILENYDEILVLEQGLLLEHGPYDSLSQQRKRLLAVQ